MAKRKAQQAEFVAGMIMVGVGLLVLVLPVVLPATVFFGALYYFYKYYRNKNGVKGQLSDFWLNDIDKKTFEELALKLNTALHRVESAMDEGRAKGISVNADGSFSKRSKVGAELQRIVETSQEIIENVKPELEHLRHLPRNRWLMLQKNYSRFLICAFSSVVFAIIFVFLPLPTISDSDGGIVVSNFESIWVADSITFVTFVITLFFSKRQVKEITPEPPLVDEHNVNLYWDASLSHIHDFHS